MYFDMIAMPVPDQLRALEAAQKFIKKQMKPADLMAIMKYDGGVGAGAAGFHRRPTTLLA